MIWLHALWVFLAGMLQPVQSGMNAELSRHAAAPLTAATWNMLLGFVVVALICVFSGAPVPGVNLLRVAPVWSLWGGLCGAVIVFTMLFNAPVLGAVLLLSCDCKSKSCLAEERHLLFAVSSTNSVYI